MSAPKDDRGYYVIDPAELHRVFPFQPQDRSINQSIEPLPTSLGNPIEPINSPLSREVTLLREMVDKAEANADHWRALAERQQALLENKKPKEPRSFLRRLLGR
uniref:Entry exclusion protein 1 n=2 Tax=Paracoccus marcusii TaxID=59779 RepID=R4R308_9RHOB|nr:entry exclusion protein 1 [Paracoccus marcusii]